MLDIHAAGMLLAVTGLLGLFFGRLWRLPVTRGCLGILMVAAFLIVTDWNTHLQAAFAAFLVLTALYARRLVSWEDAEAGAGIFLLLGVAHLGLFLFLSLTLACAGQLLTRTAPNPAGGRPLSAFFARPLPLGAAGAIGALTVLALELL